MITGEHKLQLVMTVYERKEHGFRFYKIFDPAITKEGVDAVSVSLESSRRGSAASHPGRAVARCARPPNPQNYRGPPKIKKKEKKREI